MAKKTTAQLDREIVSALSRRSAHAHSVQVAGWRGFNRYRDLPADEARGNPQRAWGTVHANRLGTYWTVEVDVPLAELAELRPVKQSATRLKSVATARKEGIHLPPMELGVFKDGSAWIVDGNHRLIDARNARLLSVPVTFTFVGS